MTNAATDETQECEHTPSAMTGDQMYAINMEAIASRERIEMAVRTAARDGESEQRRTVALMYALASYGLGPQALNPPLSKPGDDDILIRAGKFDEFIRGASHEAVIVPIGVPPKFGE